MEASQAKEQFRSVKQEIDQAAQLCQLKTSVPEQVREALDALSRESDRAAQTLAKESNGQRIVQCIDSLEKLGDRAQHACSQAGNTVDEQVRKAVQEAHDALSELKHRLH